MKLPNGYGTVYKLTGNRRRPWVVKKTIDGRQKPLGYFPTREEAFAFLVSVNRMTPEKEITFSALYHAWKARHFETIGASSRSAYEISYKHLSPLHSVSFRNITYNNLQSTIDGVKAGYCTRKKCRVLLSQLYQYAMKNGIVETDLSRFIELPRHVPVYTKRPFTARQIGKLWKSAEEVKGVKDVLILIYTGMRAGEYISLAAGDVNLRQQYINVKKSKTLAGIRKIPIHRKILPILMERKAEGIICPCGNYESFRRLFDHAMESLGMHHTPHECRHTLATMLDRAGANETAVKMILGHARTGVTKGVYTHKTLADLKKAINKV
jgi:integrase